MVDDFRMFITPRKGTIALTPKLDFTFCKIALQSGSSHRNCSRSGKAIVPAQRKYCEGDCHVIGFILKVSSN